MTKPVRIAAMAPSVPRNPKAEAQHARAVATSKQSPKVVASEARQSIRGKAAEREMAEMERAAAKAKGKR